MSVLKEGFESSPLFQRLKEGFESQTPDQKAEMLKKVNSVFQMIVKNKQGVEQSWVLDLKDTATVSLGIPLKSDIAISLLDQTFVDLANGKINGQKAFMSGKLKIKGNMYSSSLIKDAGYAIGFRFGRVKRSTFNQSKIYFCRKRNT
jgi:putative sterol carrier protein